MTDATRVMEEYLGEGKEILEILRNPWNEEKAMLLVEGWDKEDVVLACEEVYFILTSKIKIGIKEGVIITDDPVLFKKEVKVEGKLEKKTWKGQTFNVIVVSNLEVMN